MKYLDYSTLNVNIKCLNIQYSYVILHAAKHNEPKRVQLDIGRESLGLHGIIKLLIKSIFISCVGHFVCTLVNCFDSPGVHYFLFDPVN